MNDFRLSFELSIQAVLGHMAVRFLEKMLHVDSKMSEVSKQVETYEWLKRGST